MIKYNGQLYAKLGRRYCPTGKTGQDWDDLLAALERIMASPMVNYDDIETDDCAAIDQARAALARAKGGAVS